MKIFRNMRKKLYDVKAGGKGGIALEMLEKADLRGYTGMQKTWEEMESVNHHHNGYFLVAKLTQG